MRKILLSTAVFFFIAFVVVIGVFLLRSDDPDLVTEAPLLPIPTAAATVTPTGTATRAFSVRKVAQRIGLAGAGGPGQWRKHSHRVQYLPDDLVVDELCISEDQGAQRRRNYRAHLPRSVSGAP